jgi:hypothetical protein
MFSYPNSTVRCKYTHNTQNPQKPPFSQEDCVRRPKTRVESVGLSEQNPVLWLYFHIFRLKRGSPHLTTLEAGQRERETQAFLWGFMP